MSVSTLLLALLSTTVPLGNGGDGGDPRPEVVAVRTNETLRIDGRLDEPAWQTAQPINALTQVEPRAGEPASEDTEVRFLYDEDTLYIGIRFHDSDPSEILTTTRARDAFLDVDDRVEMILDTFLDRRNAFFFQINAGGSKGDALIRDNGRSFNKPWDGIWDGASSVDEGGWSCELALPFKTLNFDPAAPAWGFNMQRFIGRKREEARWANPSRDQRLFQVYHAGLLRGLEGIHQGVGLDIVPSFASHWTNDRVGGDKTLSGDPGLDAFYKIIPTLTLSLTLNTDFAETEVDERQVNLTRFPLFFPERRDFFLQDSGVFTFGDGDSAAIPFFSRRIGLLNGDEVPILGGAKLTGRAGRWGIGVLDVQTDDSGDLDAQNLFASRFTRDLGEQSQIGTIITHGNPAGTGDNSVVGLDASFRTSRFAGDKDLVATGFFLHSDSEIPDQNGDTPDSGEAFGVSLRAPNDVWNWRLGFLEVQEDFDPALGFVPRSDVRRYNGGLTWQPRPGGDLVRQYEFSIDTVAFTDTDGNLETWDTEVQPFGVFFESGDATRIEVTQTHEELLGDFEISDGVVIPAGEYDFSRVRLEAESARERDLSSFLTFSTGDFFDGDRDQWSTGLAWHPGPLFNGSLEYERNEVSLPGGDFTTQLARLRGEVSFSAELTWNSFVQWDTQSDTIGIQSRLRWIPEPHQEVFLVLNEELEADSSSSSPVFEDLSFKVAYAIRF
jgi:hypothetical protein